MPKSRLTVTISRNDYERIEEEKERRVLAGVH